MSQEFPGRAIGEVRMMSPEIVDIAIQRKLARDAIRQQMAGGASRTDIPDASKEAMDFMLGNQGEMPPEPVQPKAENFREALGTGNVEGLLGGATMYGDETWYDTSPPPEKINGVAMKVAESQQQTREEQ